MMMLKNNGGQTTMTMECIRKKHVDNNIMPLTIEYFTDKIVVI